jgi:hypothetical protein
VPVEWSGQDDAHEDPLTVLGDVPEPGPSVLDAARERLWSLVAAEMLAFETDQAIGVQADQTVRVQADQTLPASAERPPQFRRRTSGDSQ